METWAQFRVVILQWTHSQITDDQFYAYMRDSQFCDPGDRRVADIFMAQHDNGEWSHDIHHRM